MEKIATEKITVEQQEKFIEIRNSLLEKIDIFEEGMCFPMNYDEQEECRRMYWIESLKTMILALDFGEYTFIEKDFTNYSEFEYGMLIKSYFSEIREIFLSEFGRIISPFGRLLREYEEAVIQILNR